MPTITGPASEILTTTSPPLENLLDIPPSFTHSVGRIAGNVAKRTLLPLASALTGAYIALHGAQYDTEVDGIRVEVSTDIGTAHQGLSTEVKVEGIDSEQTLGGVAFDEFLKPLPIEIQATAYPGAREVGLTISERYRYIDSLKHQAEQEAYDAAGYFVLRAGMGTGAGLAAGLLMNEMVAGAWRGRQPTSFRSPDGHPILTGLGYSSLAVAIMVSGGAVAGSSVQLNTSHYKGFGAIGEAIHSPNALSQVQLSSPLLESIVSDFKEAHACPETTFPLDTPDDALTITTYNIKRGMYSSSSSSGIYRELAASDSDVILLQEATAEVADTLASELGMHAITGWTIQNPDLTYGNVILTRLPVEYAEYIPLPTPDTMEPRGAIVAELESPVNGEPFLVANMHLTNEVLALSGDTHAAVRSKQAQALVARLVKIRRDNEAIAIGGDLNERVDGAAYSVLTRQFDDMASGKLKDAATFPANGLRFDNIMTTQDSGWKTVAASRGGGGNSDHCSVSVSLEMSDQYITPQVDISATAATPAPSSRKSD